MQASPRMDAFQAEEEDLWSHLQDHHHHHRCCLQLLPNLHWLKEGRTAVKSPLNRIIPPCASACKRAIKAPNCSGGRKRNQLSNHGGGGGDGDGGGRALEAKKEEGSSSKFDDDFFFCCFFSSTLRMRFYDRSRKWAIFWSQSLL